MESQADGLKSRTQALKVRSNVISKCKNETEQRMLFESIHTYSVGNTKYAQKEGFQEFVEDSLGVVISDTDCSSIYALYDCDGDGKVSVEDFVKFLSSQSSGTEAASVLSAGNANVIVDIKLSTSRAMEAELQQQGYTCVTPQFSGSVGALDKAAFGSFGKGQSMWIWRRQQGTCGGRLKPIVDIQLDNSSISSALVLSGYICLNLSISGQYIWIKRATSPEEEDADGIIALNISTGKMKDPTDPIWQGPGGGASGLHGGVARDGWIRVDGNFGRGILSVYDAFLWFQPIKPKSLDAYMSNPTK